MAVHQFSLFGEVREVINGVVTKITTIENTASSPTAQGLGARQTEVCRECVRSEQSDGMYGNHCGKCDCCK
jgi:hypothetical protein